MGTLCAARDTQQSIKTGSRAKSSKILCRPFLLRPPPAWRRLHRFNMALNAASHNVTGDPTGSPSGPPPPVSSEIASAAQTAAKKDALGNNVPGKDQQDNDSGQTVMGAAGKPKTAKEIEKERKKAEKLAKFQEKQSKKQVPAADTASKAPKKEKVKKAAAVDAYEPQKIESGRYEWWESRGFFKPQFTKDGKIKPEGKFVIPIPPPNVTGSLHMGHALTNSLQDTMIRHARMKGKTTAWIPGCDHAGIATQSVVERMVYKTEGKTRHDLGRDVLLEKIWSWKEKYHSNITNQLKRLEAQWIGVERLSPWMRTSPLPYARLSSTCSTKVLSTGRTDW